MEAKFGYFSEMANLLSVKSRVSSDITVLFERFSLGRLLSRMDMRKEQGYSLVQLIICPYTCFVCAAKRFIQPIWHIFRPGENWKELLLPPVRTTVDGLVKTLDESGCSFLCHTSQGEYC